MDTALKIAMVVLIAALIIGAIAGIASLSGTAAATANTAIGQLSGDSHGGAYGAYRDNEYIYHQSGPGAEMSPADVMLWASAIVNPARNTALGGDPGTDTFTGGPTTRGWLLALAAGAAALLASIVGIKWVTALVFGAGD